MQHPSYMLVINPGSTSTKIAVFEGDKSVYQETLRHQEDELKPYANVAAQFAFRKQLIVDALHKAGFAPQQLSLIVGRGGLLKPIVSGVYEVNDALRADLQAQRYGEHASNLGALIAYDLASTIPAARAFIADPVVVDELQPVARYTGLPGMVRRSVFHALNQKAIARMYAKQQGASYDSLNLIVAHMGGGVSVGAHSKGQVIDVNNALDGDGPMSAERSGSLPTGQLVDLCFDGRYTKEHIKQMLAGRGGFVAHAGTNQVHTLVAEAQAGNHTVKVLLDAFSYQVGKEIGAMAAVLHGQVNAILLTGGVAYNPMITDYITHMCSFVAPVHVYPGEDEMAALALNVREALAGNIPIRVYK